MMKWQPSSHHILPQISKVLIRSAQIGATTYVVSKAIRPLVNRRTLKKLRGSFAVVTGASQGIGFELAKELARLGCDLLIVSNSPKIEEAATELSHFGTHIESAQVDLSTFKGVEQLYAQINDFGRPLDILAINAGVGYGGDFVRENALLGVLELIQLNVTSSVHLAKRVLEDMVQRNSGRVLFTSSIAASMAGSYESVYAASKAFIESFAQGIRNELRDTDVTITTLLPGATDTNFFHRAQMDDTRVGEGKKDDPALVARQGILALVQGRSYIIAGSFKNKVLMAIAKFFPQIVTAQIHRLMSKPTTSKQSRAA